MKRLSLSSISSIVPVVIIPLLLCSISVFVQAFPSIFARRSTQSVFNLTVIHNNDFHTHFVPIKTTNYGECETEQDLNSSACVGGAARTVALMKHFRETEKNILFLNAGDHFQGTFWYTLLKSEVVAKFVNLMQHDVMAIGNHEFDDGGQELRNFIDKVTTNDSAISILSSNLVIDPKSPLYGAVQKSTIRVIDGVKIAIIGYTTPDTIFLSKPGKLVSFRDEIDSIREEIAQLKKSDPTLRIFIAVGHSGFERDKEIANAIADLDLVVGGHSHTFLYTGTDLPSQEKPLGDYPVVVQHAQSPTLVVQAFAYGKYLGKLDLQFDEFGRITHYEGKPIYIDSTFKQDKNTEKLVQDISGRIGEDMKRQIGYTAVDLIGPQVCRHQECNMGNLITDAFAARFDRLRVDHSLPTACNKTLAVINGGNIRSSISAGNVTYKSVISTLPFSNQLGLLSASGDDLLDLFRQSALQYWRGGFMQVSAGLRVSYNRLDDDEKRIELNRLQVNCGNGWESIQSNRTYLVVLNDFVVNGGDNYTINRTKWIDYMLSDSEVVVQHIESVGNVTTGIEDRVRVDGKSSASTQVLYINLLLLVALLHFWLYKRYY